MYVSIYIFCYLLYFYCVNNLKTGNPKNVFSVTGSVQPNTKGLWFAPYIMNKNSNNDNDIDTVIFVDTCGLFSPESNEQSDARIVTLTSLISSLLIYNHNINLNANEMERFNFLVQCMLRIYYHILCTIYFICIL